MTQDWSVDFTLTRREVQAWLRHVQGRTATVELGPRTISLEVLGMRIGSPQANRLVLWTAFKPLQEDADHFFLPFAPSGVVILPRLAFACYAEAELFRQEFERRRCKPWEIAYAHGNLALRS